MTLDRKSRTRRRDRCLALILIVAAGSIGGSTRLDEPPRYDGAGYATLGLALSSGRGYRDVGHPDAPPHSHFPPGYPAALGLLWTLQGRPSLPSAHLLSIGCGLFAAWATYRWWLSTEPRAVAGLLGLALAANWTWGRVGGSIRSEPLYLAIGGLTLLLAGRAGRGGGIVDGAALGAAMGAGLLTRHVAACVALAVAIDLWLRGRRVAVASASITAALLVAPWVAWLARAGSRTQAGLFRLEAFPSLLADQALFYSRRIPDTVTGPFVEAATVFGRSPRLAWLATAWAVAASAVVVLGWARMIRSPRRRLGALIPLATMALLLAWPFTEAGRFLIPLVPSILMGAVEGLVPILKALRNCPKTGSGTLEFKVPDPVFGQFLRIRRPRRWAAGLVLAASLPYAAYSIVTDRAGAQRRTHEGFDEACRWIARSGLRPGPVLARYPADVAWLTGRPAVEVPAEGPASIARTIGRYRVAYLLVDEARFANADATPLPAYVRDAPDQVRLVWAGRGPVAVYEVIRGPAPEEGPP